ncbi:MAG TPA: PSD1 and planctomycete cytochrome C domain-containing protein [Pirellulales bacterium]|nr:PSD1 and planctomycete cytochrome C domain-containing protein [Pirellulales bacterium]
MIPPVLRACNLRIVTGCFAGLLGLNATTAAIAVDRETSARFAEQIAPLFARHCLGCHNPSDQKGGLDLTRAEGLTKGGESGPAVVPGDADASLLWQRVAADEMPPERTTPASRISLTAAEKATLREWIAAGAEWGAGPIDALAFSTDRRAGVDWWSLRPIAETSPPGSHPEATVNTIDAFIVARLEAAGLQPSPPAGRRVLIRRLSFDLIGLPPSPDEVEAFLNDASPSAYEQLVERLLASPHYGERWARHWLDVVRFAESQGFERDRLRTNAWPYRDWVVAALNDDMPYDEFLLRQIAGDVLWPDDPTALVATGFLVAGPWDEVGQTQQSEAMKAVVRQDELEDLVAVTTQTCLGLTVHCARCHDHKFDPVSQVDYYRVAAALGGVRHGERKTPTGTGLLAGGAAYAVTPQQPETTYLLRRGDTRQRGDVISPGGVKAVAAARAEFGLPPDAPEAERRVKLARWITAPENPLTARVIVNRLWQYHFGVGLVDTPNDFGFNGGRPSHPELLDWLAAELVRNRWSLKQLHRAIVLSAAYRQAATFDTQAARVDAANRLLWRKTPLRLEAEELRDAVLAVAGQLNRTVGGPGYQDFRTFTNNSQFYEVFDAEGFAFQRRSLYRTCIRSGTSPLLDVLDCPDPSATAPTRAVTTTPLQALALLNDSFMLRMADRFAERLRDEAGGDVAAQVDRAYRLAFARPVSADEQAIAQAFVSQHGLAAFCRVIFNANEFLYVE